MIKQLLTRTRRAVTAFLTTEVLQETAKQVEPVELAQVRLDVEEDMAVGRQLREIFAAGKVLVDLHVAGQTYTCDVDVLPALSGDHTQNYVGRGKTLHEAVSMAAFRLRSRPLD